MDLEQLANEITLEYCQAKIPELDNIGGVYLMLEVIGNKILNENTELIIRPAYGSERQLVLEFGSTVAVPIREEHKLASGLERLYNKLSKDG
jgi:hypothetical protein